MKYTVTDMINKPYQVFLIRCFSPRTTPHFSNKTRTTKTIAKTNKPIRMLEIINHITLHSKTTHDIITCASCSLYDKRRGLASKISYIAYILKYHVFYPVIVGNKTLLIKISLYHESILYM